MAKDKRKGKKRKKLVKQLKEKINLKVAERTVLLEQLALLDARIDEVDEFIVKIDKKIPPLVDEINNAADAIKTAYAARITAGCRSDLEWRLESTIQNKATLGEEIQTFVCSKRSPNHTNKTGVKYYRKQQNRDYGTSVVASFVGIITAGHDVMAIVSNDDTSAIQIDDVLTDSFVQPETFTIGELPKVVGFGTTTAIQKITEIGGFISAGSTIFAQTGIGTTSSAQVGFHLELASHFNPETTIVGFGVTEITLNLETPAAGVSTNTVMEVPSFILSQAAIATLNTRTNVDVGIKSTFPSLELDTPANLPAYRYKFVAFRVDKDANDEYTDKSIDSEFDYTKSPIDPLEIGLIRNSTVGYGHSIRRIQNGDAVPDGGSEYWESQRSTSSFKVPGFDVKDDHPEPDVGAGRASYIIGAPSWPIIINNTDNGQGGRNYSSDYAVEGQTTTTGLGTAAGYSIVTPTIPAPTNCAALDTAIADAITNHQNIQDANNPKIDKYLKKTKVLRKLRDEMELEAWGLLQGAAFNRAKIEDMLNDTKELDAEDFEDFDPD